MDGTEDNSMILLNNKFKRSAVNLKEQVVQYTIHFKNFEAILLQFMS